MWQRLFLRIRHGRYSDLSSRAADDFGMKLLSDSFCTEICFLLTVLKTYTGFEINSGK